MVNKIPSKIPDDEDFKSQHAGGINQYGMSNPENPEQFQSYMNDGMTQGIDNQNTTSPMDMMSQNQNFGPPTTPGNSLDSAAPENFGPPGIAQTSEGQESSFGAPQFQQPQNQNFAGSSSNLSSSNLDNSPQSNNPPSSNPSGKKPKKKESYQAVEKMEFQNMLQNAMSHMRVKDPDPEAWK